MITTCTWPNIWLKRASGAYCEILPKRRIRQCILLCCINSDMSDAKNATQSVYVVDTSNVGLLFDWNSVYAKGSVVLHMLRHVLGDSTFFHAMYNYAHDPRYRFGNATTSDFQGVCETTSGKSLSYFFNEWVYGQSYPQYSTGSTGRSDRQRIPSYCCCKLFRINIDPYISPCLLISHFQHRDGIRR